MGSRPVGVFSSGVGGYRVFRIPAIARSMRTLLAFAEARPTVHDHGKIDLVLRRSSNGGRSWDSLQIVAGSTTSRQLGWLQTVGNPSPVVASNGDVVLLFCSNDGKVNEDTIRSGQGGRGRRIWVMRSSDAGAQWSAPVEITSSVKRPDWTWYATGPGGAFRLSNGSLVVPATHATVDGRDQSHLLLSDDSGETWRLGGDAASPSNEATAAELADGSVLLNARDLSTQRLRLFQRSTDGGFSWWPPWRAEELIEPPPRGCHGAMIAAGGGRTLFFSHPSSPLGRERGQMMIYRSDDGGHSWPQRLLVHDGPAAYSSLLLLPDGDRLGLLYERGERPGSFFAQRIVFERIAFGQGTPLSAAGTDEG